MVILAGSGSARIIGMCVCACKPAYDTSLTDGQWAVIAPLLPTRTRAGADGR
ncbi:hypothetical protein GCM10010517_81960 [Streptosporangium fragile]|uniref:Transposase n=1 Tax=Streptosporangium fragile TaxID=46186 RepID=A0ABN3WKD9_9ACTN